MQGSGLQGSGLQGSGLQGLMPPLIPLGAQHPSKLQALTPRFKDLYSGRKAVFEVTSLKPARAYRFRLRAQRMLAGGKRLAKGLRAAEWSPWYEAVFSCAAAPPLQLLPLGLSEAGASAHTLRLLCRGLVGCGAPITCVRLELQVP